MGWRVVLEWLGRTWTWDDVPGSLVEEVELFGTSALTPRSFPMSEIPPLVGISMNAEIAAGHTLQDARATVYYVDSDGEATSMLVGRLRAPQWLRDEETWGATIVEASRGAIDYPGAVPTEYRWVTGSDGQQYGIPAFPGTILGGGLSGSADDQLGAYPVVFGRPGAGLPGSPVRRIDIGGTVHLVICDTIGITATTVSAYIRDGSTWEEIPSLAVQSSVVDSAGRSLATILEGDVDSGAVATFEAGDEVLIGWTADARSPLLSDVLEHLLSHVPARVDVEQIRAYAPQLDRYRVDTYFAEPADIWEIIDEVLEPYPACLVQGRQGVYVWVWDPEAPSAGHLVVGELDTHTGVYEDGQIQVPEQAPLRSARIRHTRLASTDDYYAITPTRGAYYRAAEGQLDGESLEIEAGHIADAATAQRCADLLMRARGLPARRVPLQVERARWGHLRAGDAVTLTWSELYITARRGVVTRIEDDAGPLLAIVVTLPTDPAAVAPLPIVRAPDVEYATPPAPPALPPGAWGIWDPLLSPGTYT